MKRYFVDTSVIINYLRDAKGAVGALDELDGELSSSFVCLSELYEGIYRVKDKKRAEKGVLDFFKGLSRVYGLDEDIAKNFGRLRAELKEEGKIIEDLDILIAATCVANNLILATYNAKHFKRVQNLQILGLE